MRNALPDIFVSKSDFERLSSLAFYSKAPTARDLEDELDRAVVVENFEIPTGVVAMNSTVAFQDLSSGAITRIKLVYPEQATVGDGLISILAPLGIALLGLRLNDVIEWPMPGGSSRRLKVTAIFAESEQIA